MRYDRPEPLPLLNKNQQRIAHIALWVLLFVLIALGS